MSKQKYDVAVLGLGAMGSATVYQLALRGKSVIGFEQFSPLHTLGSYHGDTRITRQALGEGEYYGPLSLRSNKIWHDLETKTGEKLFIPCGVLITAFGERAINKGDFFQTTLSAAIQNNIQHEVLNYSELSHRFPQFLYQEGETGYFEPGAGFLRPELCVSVQQKLASELGAKLMFETSVLELHQMSSGGVKICTGRGNFEASQVVVSAGSWIHRFIPKKFSDNFSIYRQVLYWYEPEKGYTNYSLDKCPVYVRIGASQPEEIYGFPSVDGIGGGLKMATENFYKKAESVENLCREVSDTETKEAFNVFSQYLALRSKCIRSVVCVYTSTPDHDFVIDFLPDFPECLLLSPCSGHGFKHSAAVGEIAAQLLTRGTCEMDLSSFRLDRFER